MEKYFHVFPKMGSREMFSLFVWWVVCVGLVGFGFFFFPFSFEIFVTVFLSSGSDLSFLETHSTALWAALQPFQEGWTPLRPLASSGAAGQVCCTPSVPSPLRSMHSVDPLWVFLLWLLSAIPRRIILPEMLSSVRRDVTFKTEDLLSPELTLFSVFTYCAVRTLC